MAFLIFSYSASFLSSSIRAAADLNFDFDADYATPPNLGVLPPNSTETGLGFFFLRLPPSPPPPPVEVTGGLSRLSGISITLSSFLFIRAGLMLISFSMSGVGLTGARRFALFEGWITAKGT